MRICVCVHICMLRVAHFTPVAHSLLLMLLVIACTVLCCAGYTQDRFYIHCDGALFGMMMPFIKEVSGLWVLC